MNSEPIILAIDTSCDETSVAVVQGRRILANVIASQVELQKKYGGVYPIEAKRQHEKVINAVVEEAMKRAKRNNNQSAMTPKQLKDSADVLKTRNDEFKINAVAVTVGPGLAPALEVGIRKAKELCEEWNLPLIAVNHMEGHLMAPLAQDANGGGRYESNNLEIVAKNQIPKQIQDEVLFERDPSPLSSGQAAALGMTNEIRKDLEFPVLGLLISGGHTEIILMTEIGKYEILGDTLDDAAGECLDKVSRMLGLGYPGGAVIEEFAQLGNPGAIKFPVPMKGKPGLDFSFSGLKTAALYEIRARMRGGNRKMEKGGDELVSEVQWGRLENLDKQFICDFCWAIQDTVIKAILYRLEQAVKIHKPKWVFLGGGVGANKELRKQLRSFLKKQNVKLGIPYSDKLYGDNAAMIGIAAIFKFHQNIVTKFEDAERSPRLKFARSI